MKGYLGMLESDAAVRASTFLLQVRDGIQKGTERLHEIVNSMLDLARIDNQVLDLKTEPVAISSVLRRVRIDFTPFLEERHQEIEIIGLEGLPPIQGDPTLLVKVFHNVVINAIKYTPDGGKITIQGCRKQDESLGDCIEIQVQDTGIGIDPDQQELIFEKLYSTGKVALHSSGKASFKGGGPGLGLAIARGIVLAHKGRIWAESERHDEELFPGSLFHILLPVSKK
jgi:signal transduction histidine kinase